MNTGKLKRVLDKHCTSQRSIQRVSALFIGLSENKIDPQVLRDVVIKFDAYNIPNFTQNMKKDDAYFVGDKDGWKLTPEGRKEAKAIFNDGGEPTKRRGAEPKKKTKKKTKAKKTKKKTKKKKAKKVAKKKTKAKPATKKTPTKKTPTKSTAARKAAARKRAAAKAASSASTPVAVS